MYCQIIKKLFLQMNLELNVAQIETTYSCLLPNQYMFLCDSFEETVSHLFLTCFKLNSVWDFIIH